ncbi:MAG: glutamine--fructose-6-phosphate transaminase (isomerizing) [bacterium]|nr:glutamine--fructose-6-phosphate transaminase (isomerizing) [bacterium]
MCGIIGYIGKRQALPLLVEGLRRMEYRGYDSAGVAVAMPSGIFTAHAVGMINALDEKLAALSGLAGTLGIGHTRWATHGGVTEQNAHPHADCTGDVWVAHNGIIENYSELKNELTARGHVFRSETDTEVLPHLIEEAARAYPEAGLGEQVRVALQKIIGTYGIVVLDRRAPETLIAARNFSPLLIGIGGGGIGDGEYFVASDASAVLKHTKEVIYLDDGEIAVLTPRGHHVSDLGRNTRTKTSERIEWTDDEVKKDGYAHFMLKEIHGEPEAIENSIRGRIVLEEGGARLGGLADALGVLREAQRILIVGCGTAYHAGRIGEYMLEEYASIPVETDIASEFRYRKPVFRPGDVLLAISQSGETADTLAAVREAKQKGVFTLGIVNVVGSSIARETHAGVYQHIGPEIGVASTKAFTSQVAILALLTLLVGRQRDMSLVTGERIGSELKKIPDLMREILKQERAIKKIAAKYKNAQNFFFLGRKYNLPVALEGALKLKEISYVHAEGCGAGELKHGPIAMIDKHLPSICIVPHDSTYEKMISNMEEIRARKGPIIAIATEGDERVQTIADDVIYIPKTLEMLTPLLSVIPLQLFAYHFGVQHGHDVDKPRNLAKSVTVE